MFMKLTPFSIQYSKNFFVDVFFFKTQDCYFLLLYDGSRSVLLRLTGVLNIKHNSETRTLTFSANPSANLRSLSFLWKSYFTLLNNLFNDFEYGYSVILEIRGVGYKVFLENEKEVSFNLGYSHKVFFKIPKDITFTILDAKNTVFMISGFDRRYVHQIAAYIRNFKKPDVYKGKGICFFKEVINIKERKKDQ